MQAHPQEQEFSSELVLTLNDSREVETIYQALYPETIVTISPRSRCTIEKQNSNQLVLRFYATDFVSLRAILSSFFRWIDAAYESIQSCKKI
ncbi:MAG: KEOPS complex subunit Pcc1 [Candidatus Heimdallarchaeota archaeon]|nr:MAG: hypothetical protein DRO63_05305 [Candidatus Gerdarchaeota archaeon]RLI72791.1 MAG: hypothetical protein DRP02_00745 [Candidatus Gerdarchaeota archaeon]